MGNTLPPHLHKGSRLVPPTLLYPTTVIGLGGKTNTIQGEAKISQQDSYINSYISYWHQLQASGKWQNAEWHRHNQKSSFQGQLLVWTPVQDFPDKNDKKISM